MELSVREWMMIVGMLLIVAVFLDGYRRVRNERRNRIRVSLSKQAFQLSSESEDDEVDVNNPELPNGGARIIPKSRRDDLQLNESVPMLMESVKVGRAEPPKPKPRPAPEPEPRPIEPSFSAVDDDPVDDGPADEEPLPEPPRAVVREPVPVARPEPVPAPEPVREEDAAVQATPPQEVLVINVLSRDEAGFRGPDLLQILLACDLRFGKMNIFHRYEKANGRGQVQFSVANLVEPGTFNLDAIDSFCTPGVSFFLALPGPEEPIRAFDYMVETAQVLVKNLQAELRDEAQSAITAQTLEHCRQRIRDFERRQLTLHV